ncbi:MAG: photosynthetic complex putative assembly protein PuhB, partial [Pseudomonadota bacterium]
MREHENEPIPGLPEHLPAGERILWQGAPDWRALARRTFHVWKITLYCAIIVAWNAFAAVQGGATLGEATIHTLWISPLPLSAIIILLVLSYAYAKSTIYTVTTRRLVVRSGVALPI